MKFNLWFHRIFRTNFPLNSVTWLTRSVSKATRWFPRALGRHGIFHNESRSPRHDRTSWCQPWQLNDAGRSPEFGGAQKAPPVPWLLGEKTGNCSQQKVGIWSDLPLECGYKMIKATKIGIRTWQTKLEICIHTSKSVSFGTSFSRTGNSKMALRCCTAFLDNPSKGNETWSTRCCPPSHVYWFEF